MTIAISLGSIAKDNLTGLINLKSNSDSGKYQTIINTAGNHYVVPAGKRFIMTLIQISGSVANTGVKILYGDDGVNYSATPPTNAKTMNYSIHILSANFTYEYKLFNETPAGKYPCILPVTGTVTINIYGYEVDV